MGRGFFTEVDYDLQGPRFLKCMIVNIALAAVEAEKSTVEIRKTTKEAQSNMRQLWIVQALLQQSPVVGLDDLLTLTSEFKTKNPEDKVYSLLGMIKGIPVNIVLNCKLSVETVFFNVEYYLLKSNADFVLQRAGIRHPRKVYDIPS